MCMFLTHARPPGLSPGSDSFLGLLSTRALIGSLPLLKVRLRKPREVSAFPPPRMAEYCALRVRGKLGLGGSKGPKDVWGTYLSTWPGLRKGYLMFLGSRVMQSTLANPAMWGDLGQIVSRLRASVSSQAEKGDKRNLAGLS